MTKLTKDQVRKLTPEQQEAWGDKELKRLQVRHELLERARRGMRVGAGLWTGLLTGLAGGLPILCVALPRALPFAIIAVVYLVNFHAILLHRDWMR